MNYQNIYNKIIINAKIQNRKKLSKGDKNYIYYENHHILPKCLNGTDDNENLVLLTAKEHYFVHKLLTYIYKRNRKLVDAFFLMTFDKTKKHKIPFKDYAYARELYNLTPISEETRKKIGNKGKLVGNKNGMYKKSIYDVWLNKFGKIIADEKLIAMKIKMKTHTPSNKGMSVSNETKKKISLANNKLKDYEKREICDAIKIYEGSIASISKKLSLIYKVSPTTIRRAYEISS